MTGRSTAVLFLLFYHLQAAGDAADDAASCLCLPYHRDERDAVDPAAAAALTWIRDYADGSPRSRRSRCSGTSRRPNQTTTVFAPGAHWTNARAAATPGAQHLLPWGTARESQGAWRFEFLAARACRSSAAARFHGTSWQGSSATPCEGKNHTAYWGIFIPLEPVGSRAPGTERFSAHG